MRPCIYGRHQADAYLHVPVGPYVRLIAEHLGDATVVDGCTTTGLYLCYWHLNLWLDAADDDPTMELEPTLLAFEAPPVGAYRGYWSWWSYGGPGDGFRYGWAPAWTPEVHR